MHVEVLVSMRHDGAPGKEKKVPDRLFAVRRGRQRIISPVLYAVLVILEEKKLKKLESGPRLSGL